MILNVTEANIARNGRGGDREKGAADIETEEERYNGRAERKRNRREEQG